MEFDWKIVGETHTCIDFNDNKSAPSLLQQGDAPQPHPLYFRG